MPNSKSKRTRARIFASIYCKNYSACLNKIAKTKRSMPCSKCKNPDFVPDAYKAELPPDYLINPVESYPINVTTPTENL